MKTSFSQRSNLTCATSWDARFALTLISFYQRFLSPRKGFRCAFGVLHGGAGCSGFVRQAIIENGVRQAIPLSRARFRECKNAAQALRAKNQAKNQVSPVENGDQTAKNRQKNAHPKRSAGHWCDCDTSFCSCADTIFDCGPGDSGICDCTPCDCNPFN